MATPMTPLSVYLDVEQTPWSDLEPDAPSGMLTRVGLLRHGTDQGNASVGLVVTLDDGTHVLAQTTWKLFRMAYTACASSPIVAEEVLDP